MSTNKDFVGEPQNHSLTSCDERGYEKKAPSVYKLKKTLDPDKYANWCLLSSVSDCLAASSCLENTATEMMEVVCIPKVSFSLLT